MLCIRCLYFPEGKGRKDAGSLYSDCFPVGHFFWWAVLVSCSCLIFTALDLDLDLPLGLVLVVGLMVNMVYLQ